MDFKTGKCLEFDAQEDFIENSEIYELLLDNSHCNTLFTVYSSRREGYPFKTVGHGIYNLLV